MRIAVVAPSPVPFRIGGAENLAWGLVEHLNQKSPHRADLIKIPSNEGDFWSLVDTYKRFSELDLSHFDLVISTKYPSWMVEHPNHVCYMLHRLRGLYDTYHLMRQPYEVEHSEPAVLSLLEFMDKRWADREALADFFARLFDLRNTQNSSRSLFGFPGPFARRVTHFLDGVGLARNRIRRFRAISKTVADRSEYFPVGVNVGVAYPPTHLRGLRNCLAEYILTVSRLDGAKRMRLVVEAMRFVDSPVRLKVVGAGPDEALLKELAAGDDRIEFLGFVNDSQLVELYSDALGVVFVPHEEDYGLITIEAMLSGKPVITATDSGGPTEFVEDGVTGFVVDPRPESLAQRMEHIFNHADEARELGHKAKTRVESITWERTVAKLLEPEARSASVQQGLRKTISLFTTYPIFPPRHGGQLRTFHLYRHLGRDFDVRLITLDRQGKLLTQSEIAPGVEEIRVPKSRRHEEEERRLTNELGGTPITDIAFGKLYSLTPEYMKVATETLTSSDIVIASHPYATPALMELGCDIDCYDSQNVEADLKRSILPEGEPAESLLQLTREMECSACERSKLITACSDQDLNRIQELYKVASEKLIVIPNGVNVEATPFVAPEERNKLKRDLGLASSFIALFVGSWHGPNIEAAEFILELAQHCEEVTFVLVGGAGQALKDRTIPENVAVAGVVENDEKELWLRVADVAVNPMLSGSGTNLKVLEYCAAGLPVVSTPHGIRGLKLRGGEHLESCDLDNFAEVLLHLRRGEGYPMSRIQRARELTEELYDWRKIAESFSAEIKNRLL